MLPVNKLLAFGLRQVIGEAAGRVFEVVEQHFTDHRQALPKALARANDRSWQALGIALAGDGFLDQIKVFFASSDDKGIREQVRLFLQDKTIGYEGMSDDFRQRCLAELKKAKQAGLLTFQNLSSKDVARQTADFERFANPKGMADSAAQVMQQIADDLGGEFPNLGKLLRRPTPRAGPPLLVVAFSYFFHREVETNAELSRGLVFDELRQLSASQERAFDEVNKALISLGDTFEQVFQQLQRIETGVDEIQHKQDVQLQQLGSITETQVDQNEKLGGIQAELHQMHQSLKHWSRKERCFHRARGNLDNGTFDRALAYVNEALRFDHEDADAYRLRAEVYVAKFNHADDDVTIDHDFKQAIADATKAIQIDHEDAQAYRIRADAYMTMWAIQGDDDLCYRTIADATKVISLAPHDAEIYCARAEAYLCKEDVDYERAIDDANAAIRIDPASAQAYKLLATAYSENEEYDKAISAVTQALRLEPDDRDNMAYERSKIYQAQLAAMLDDPVKNYRAIVSHPEAVNLKADILATLKEMRKEFQRKRAAGEVVTAQENHAHAMLHDLLNNT